MMRFRLVALIARAFAFAFAFVVAGCGGGGGGGSTPTPSNFTTTASLTLVIPPATAQSIARKANYISPNTTSIVVVIDNVNGSTTIPPGFATTTTIPLKTGSSGNCGAATAAGETCNVQIPAPAGAVVYTFTILDSAGQPLATAKAEFTIVKGQANSNLQVVLGGIVASVKFALPSFIAGIRSQGTLTVQAFDASGALIDASAPYAVPIVITDTDSTKHTHLQLNNVIGPQVQVNVASNVVTLLYDGTNNVPAFAINATVGTTTVGTTGSILIVPYTSAISFSNTTIDTGETYDPNYGLPTIYFATVGTPSAPVTATTTASESGYGGSFTASLDSTTCFPSTGQVASITPSTGTTFTITALNPGVCRVTVND
ncbi:MAG: hypothetical protein IAI50_09765, partial [Candidatus Eremiobacteraeota bacterium]|nr:hypothetical protein [Candidatus Eremiobacteraeota bacterium]